MLEDRAFGGPGSQVRGMGGGSNVYAFVIL